MQDVVDVADKAERKGADQQSRDQVAQHRADAQPPRQGNGNDRRCKKHHRFLQEGHSHYSLPPGLIVPMRPDW